MKRKVALVSASTSGIGKQIVKDLLKKNYIVYVNGRNEKKLNKAIKKLNNDFAKPILGDMRDELIIIDSINKIKEEENRLDLVVANLGSGKSIPGWNIDISEYRRMFDINLFAAICLSTHSIELLKKTEGNIIFISSIAGCETLGAPISYSSAKTALLSFSNSLSKEVANLNIRVNCISPGNVMFDGSTWDTKKRENEDDVVKYIKENVPLNGFAKPKDISRAILFLEKSSFITGSNIIIDGGQIKKII